MTTLASHKGSYTYKFNKSTSSLAKVPDASCHVSAVNSRVFTQKPNVSFQSFRMTSSLPQSNTAVKVRGTTSQRHNELLQEITNSLPKISSVGFNSSQLAAALSKKSPTHTKSTEYDLESSHMGSMGRRPAQTTQMAQSQRSFLPFGNKSTPDIQFKLGPESSPNNQLISSRSPAHSLLSTNSPKKAVVEEKLPLKRRALNQDIREAYRTVINSKEHGAFQDLPQKSFEKDSINLSPQRNKNKKVTSIDHMKEIEQREKDKEEERLADDIKAKGMGDFRRKIALYNFIRGNYLVEPESEMEFKPTTAALNRKMVVAPVKTEDKKKDFMSSMASFQNYYMQSRAQSRESLEKSEMNSRRFDDREYSRKTGDDDEVQISKRTNGNVTKRTDERVDTGKGKESSMEQDLRKMQELGSILSARKTMSDNEQLVFKLVKDGNEQDLSYLLAKFSELVKAEDNTKQTPLHWAIKRGYYNIVVCLCKYGADIYAADMTDRRPLDMAERLKQTEILEYLRILHKKKEMDSRFC